MAGPSQSKGPAAKAFAGLGFYSERELGFFLREQ